ncbi:hypothetical protein [Pseudonocardia sp. ICBG1293]|uniref:hypothetical protein n=1 Tax=Pseudonocardia sp. ICBG1293 TaxID=2844382 RepID=UPI001CCEBB63|nr:hypothetical protein [Pseudonocardia sp. ICBG1293]
MSDDAPQQSRCSLAEVRWISFWVTLILGFIGWLPVLGAALLAGFGYLWVGLLQVPENQELRIAGAAISIYLIANLIAAFKGFILARLRGCPWYYWNLFYAVLTFGVAIASGWMFRIDPAFLVVYSGTVALCGGIVEIVWLKPWQPGPSDELLAARRAALRRGDDPSLITEDDIRRTSDLANNPADEEGTP